MIDNYFCPNCNYPKLQWDNEKDTICPNCGAIIHWIDVDEKRPKGLAKIREIQICGGRLFTNLHWACQGYIEDINSGIDRRKLNFSIVLPNGQVKHITFRQEDEDIIVYGDFEGLASVLDYAEEVTGRQVSGGSLDK